MLDTVVPLIFSGLPLLLGFIYAIISKLSISRDLKWENNNWLKPTNKYVRKLYEEVTSKPELLEAFSNPTSYENKNILRKLAKNALYCLLAVSYHLAKTTICTEKQVEEIYKLLEPGKFYVKSNCYNIAYIQFFYPFYQRIDNPTVSFLYKKAFKIYARCKRAADCITTISICVVLGIFLFLISLLSPGLWILPFLWFFAVPITFAIVIYCFSRYKPIFSLEHPIELNETPRSKLNGRRTFCKFIPYQ